MAFVSDESADEVCERLSGFMVGIGVGVLLDVPVIGLVAGCVVVAVGANPAFPAGTVPVGVTVGPSNLCNGSSDHPSGIVTPGGRSALPAGMADVFERAPCLCIICIC